jgi:hypothetical protein
VCQSWKKNPNTSSQWAIPHDKNVTSKNIYREEKEKGKNSNCNVLCALKRF